jgi:acyl dehydratase
LCSPWKPFRDTCLHLRHPIAPGGDGTSILALRRLCFEDLSIGQTESFSKSVSSSDVVGFDEVTGDRNPIHLSDHFAVQTALGTRIAPGLYTASLISTLLGTRLPGRALFIFPRP